MIRAFLGIDVAKETLRAALRLPDGSLREEGFANTEAGIARLLDWSGTHAPGASPRACLEATGKHHRLPARLLAEAGIEVARINPRQARDLAKGLGLLDKSDAVDARMLARCAELGLGRAEPPPPPHAERLRDLSRRIEALTKERAREKTRLSEPSSAPETGASLARHVAWLDGEIAALEDEWARLARSVPETAERLALLRSVAGVGAKTARVLLSELPEGMDPARTVGYAGLAPREASSGTSVRRPPCVKGGNRRVRRALFLAAGVLVRLDPDARSLYDRLLDKGKPPRLALVAVAGKLARWVAAVLHRRTPWIPTDDMWKTENP